MYDYHEEYTKEEILLQEIDSNILQRILYIIKEFSTTYEHDIINEYNSIRFYYKKILINFEINSSLYANKLYLLYYESTTSIEDIQKIKDIFYFVIKK